ncbi:hypothetical protein PRIPAC_93634 [Pristionchus pacificus]|uniref:BTB domain-containing protein n=1 Tax=Pristionchus pacificus TaxID=54126 RepID=A0A2A6CI18_PRIPA|nr:hypothetical protein PRIPAC_93634 [Pristionchus pacificus]|eukprot:PDM77865.1 BTB domain-containing protein [Pristionchus pacificus]
MSYDSFAHDKCLDRCSVEIGGRRFDVSSTILASRSVYFYNCFMQPSFIESQTRFVDLSMLEGITADDFHKFLRRAYVINEPIDGNSYQSLLKCADYFSSDQILKEAENFIIAHCCPEKWQANKKSDKKPFAINLITGIYLSFKHHLENAKVCSHGEDAWPTSFPYFPQGLPGSDADGVGIASVDLRLLREDDHRQSEESTVISMVIDKWTTHQTEQLSSVHRISGYPWILRLVKPYSDDSLYLSLICDKSSEAELWKCTATFSFLALNLTRTHTFCSWDSRQWGICRGIRRGFVDFGIFHEGYKIEVSIVTEDDGRSWTLRPTIDFFAPRDRILLIGEEKKKIYVNKESLASQSTFFECLFNSDFKEKNMTEIPIGDVEYEEFFNIIKMVYNRDDVSLTDENVHRVLKLADRFDLKIVIDRVANFLLSSSSLSLPQKLLISNKYNLPLLRDVLLSRNFTNDELIGLCASEEMKLLPAVAVRDFIRMCCDKLD